MPPLTCHRADGIASGESSAGLLCWVLMARRHSRRSQGFAPRDDSEFERTLADAEAEESFDAANDFACPCGSTEFLLEAFLHVVNGTPKPVPIEVEGLTCPRCGREFEAVQLEGGRVARGDFRGWTDVDDDDD